MIVTVNLPAWIAATILIITGVLVLALVARPSERDES